MTGPEESHSSTRPISVAELLARNGTIGAPPVGGRRRRRRGNSDSVTVAELTGEIPIVSGHDVHDVHDVHETETTRTIPAVVDEEPAAPSTNGVVDHDDEVETETVDETECRRDRNVDETKPPRTSTKTATTIMPTRSPTTPPISSSATTTTTRSTSSRRRRAARATRLASAASRQSVGAPSR